MPKYFDRDRPDTLILAAAGAGLAAFGVGLAFWRTKRGPKADKDGVGTDAPHWTLDKSSERALFGKSVLINRTRDELYAAWQVDRFPEFMENVVAVEQLADQVSRWTIKGPAGHEVTFIFLECARAMSSAMNSWAKSSSSARSRR